MLTLELRMSYADHQNPLECRRLEALESYRIAGTGRESRFDHICRFASNLFSTPMAFVTLVEKERQWFKACWGTTLEETPRSESFCDHTIRANEVMVIPDAREDARFRDLPIVVGDPFIRFYAGAPLITRDGHRIGALCIGDTEVRESFSYHESEVLRGLAEMVMEQIELRSEGIPQVTAAKFANATNLSLVTIDSEARIEFVNQAALGLFGFEREEMIGKPIDIIVPNRFRAAHHAGIARAAAGGDSGMEGKSVEIFALRKDGTEFPAELTVTVWQDEPGFGIGAIISDISDRRDRDVKLMRLASQDTLTGLTNRRRFEYLLNDELQQAGKLALLLFDLDGFKDVNDRFGHGVGDGLLQAIASRLPTVLGPAATLARFGGDEFAVLVKGTGDPMVAHKVANAIIGSFKQSFEVDGNAVRVGVSVGFAMAPGHGADIEELIACADCALYRAKKAGGRVVRMFEPSMRQETLSRRAMRDELLHALTRNELRLFYQPQVILETAEIYGVEALIRWQHPKRGLLTPARFLPALEQSSVAIDIGNWVLEEACRQLAEWTSAGLRPVRMGINVFAAQVRTGDLPTAVGDLLARYELDPALLEIEITETITLNDHDQSLETIQALRELGVGIAFDDFGTGYASLSSLQRYPLTTLKIDRGFVRDLLCRPRDAAITRTMIALSSELSLNTVAEGIETLDQERALRQMGCEAGQGYRYGKPMPPEEMAKLIARQSWQVRPA